MRTLILLCLIASYPLSLTAGYDPEHVVWTQLLQASVKKGVVDYSQIQKESLKLETYLNQIKSVTPGQYEAFSEAEKMAYLINAYNAYTLKLISDFFPVKSIRDIGGKVGGNLFNKNSKQWRVSEYEANGKKFTLEAMGKPVTLDDIEHENLRPLFKDARVHFALVCGAVSCPFLRSEAYTAKRLSQQLDDQGKQFLADSFRNRFDEKSNTLYLSKIFDWFSGDFKRDAGGIKEFIKPYLPPQTISKVSDNTSISFLEYDWSLNNVSGIAP